MNVPPIYDYMRALEASGVTVEPLTFEEAEVYTSVNPSMQEHYNNWVRASAHDSEVAVPLRLYAIDLTPELFGRLIIQQLGGEPIQSDLMGSEPNGMLARVICDSMCERGLDINSFKPGGTHHSPWTERVVTYHSMLKQQSPPASASNYSL